MKTMLRPLSIIFSAVIQMLRLSVNVLNAMVTLLRRIEKFGPSPKSEIIWSSIEDVDGELLIELGQKCKWICLDESEKVCLCDDGKQLLSLLHNDLSYNTYRKLLGDYVQIVFPSWAGRIPYGRSEASILMTKDERACFYEAGLLSDNPDPGVVSWWDKLSDFIRKEADDLKNQTGRIGERATLSYEKNRTLRPPQWVSIESNLCGYDIKSQVSESDPSPLLIEVKATTSPVERAFFHITDREWNVAQASAAYRIYLWCFAAGKKKLAVLDAAEVSQFIPDNHLSGRWELVRIPFSDFKTKFVEVD